MRRQACWQPGWGSALAQLTGWAGQDQAVCLVQDGGDGLLSTPGLLLAGPDFSARPDMFIPAELIGADTPTGSLASLGGPLADASRAAAWYWLANSVELHPDHVRVRFDGMEANCGSAGITRRGLHGSRAWQLDPADGGQFVLDALAIP